MSRYRGREIDDVALWENYVEFPHNQKINSRDTYLPKVVCPNPNHDTTKRHFQVNARDGLVHCFAHCGISGTFEHAICVIEGHYEKFKVEEAPDDRERKRRTDRARRLARREILKFAGKNQRKRLANRVRVSSTEQQTITVVRPDDLSFDTYLPPFALEYLADRLISERSIAQWGIGWLKDEKRIAIPAYDEKGTLRFLIKRATSPKQQPKYLYTEGFPKTSLLFGAGQMDTGMVHSLGIGLVEGSIDTIRQHQHGHKFFGGILGTGISDRQCRIIDRIRPPRIYLWFDKDSAGITNIEIAAAKLRKYPLFVVRYPKGKSDPAETTKKESERQIGRAIPLSKFLVANGLSVKSKRRRISVG